MLNYPCIILATGQKNPRTFNICTMFKKKKNSHWQDHTAYGTLQIKIHTLNAEPPLSLQA